MNQDYDSYTLNPLDTTRIQPLLKQVSLNDIDFKFFISSIYHHYASYDLVQKHNREIRRSIRKFFKDDIRFWFFIERHDEEESPLHGSYHRHILMTDVSQERWMNPSSRMKNFGCTEGTMPTTQQKIDLVKKVMHHLSFIPNGGDAVDVRHIFNTEKLLAYVSKQFEKHHPSHEVIDSASSDCIDMSHFIHYKQNGINWTNRFTELPTATHFPLPDITGKQQESKLLAF